METRHLKPLSFAAQASIIIGTLTRDELESVATYGYKPGLPYRLTPDERFELLSQIQDIAKGLVA